MQLVGLQLLAVSYGNDQFHARHGVEQAKDT